MRLQAHLRSLCAFGSLEAVTFGFGSKTGSHLIEDLTIQYRWVDGHFWACFILSVLQQRNKKKKKKVFYSVHWSDRTSQEPEALWYKNKPST